MNWITKVRHFFFRLSSREKLLISVFIFTGLAIWTTASVRGMNAMLTGFKLSSAELEDQALWLGEADLINSRMEEVLVTLDSEKTFDSAELVGKLDELARLQDGMVFEIFSPRTVNDAEFDLHSAQIRFRRATIAQLLAFSAALRREEPYIALEDLRVSANKANPTELDTRFRVSSFELKNTTLN